MSKLAFTQVAKDRLLKGTVFKTDDKGYYVPWDCFQISGSKCEFMSAGEVIATVSLSSTPNPGDVIHVNGLDGRMRVDMTL